MRIQRICDCCRRTFECVAQSPARFCRACLIVLGLVAPHDLPHNHNDPLIHWVRSPVETVASSTSVSRTVSASSVSWSVPKRGDKPG
jgi:hypothetical protein